MKIYTTEVIIVGSKMANEYFLEFKMKCVELINMANTNGGMNTFRIKIINALRWSKE